MTQLEYAKQGIVTDEMKTVAADEQVSPDDLLRWMADGKVVIPANRNHKSLHPYGIGKSLRTKINANIGTSENNTSLEHELMKLEIIEELKAESIMDLSTAGDLNEIRQEIIDRSKIMVGTVPIYQVMTEQFERIEKIDIDSILKVIDLHGQQGVDFITVHCGITREALPLVEKRVIGIVSRGGAFLAAWMKIHG
ncbi:MAG: hypothetical protein GF310_00005, partial [candidate division Zixibacteria bacterium]|nr:hypothetical protein [candidate division Zixibacteria bacterium]